MLRILIIGLMILMVSSPLLVVIGGRRNGLRAVRWGIVDTILAVVWMMVALLMALVLVVLVILMAGGS